jgi:HAD superfamily hydrolase (TIGR01509 family)
MDGLLVDSEPLWFEVETAVMARLGGSWGEADQRALLGGSLKRSVDYFVAKAQELAVPVSAGTRDEVARWLLEGMTALITSRGLPLLPGAAELLAEVAAAGVPYALVTSSERQIMQTVLSVTGLRFPVTVCGQDVPRSKPHPDPYLRAAALLGVDPRRCVALEDSPSGIAAAQAAGCVVVAVPNVAVHGQPARLTVRSLRELDLEVLRGLAAGAVPPVCDDEGEGGGDRTARRRP